MKGNLKNEQRIVNLILIYFKCNMYAFNKKSY